MKNSNICLINDSFPPSIDGVANAVCNYGRIISEGYGCATVVTPDDPTADDSHFNFPVVRYPSVDMTRFVGYRAGLPFSPDIQRELERRHFDIIHSHCPVTSTMLARALRDRINVPVVMTYHTKFDIDIENAIRGKLLQNEAKLLLAANISACDEVWTVSRGAGENLRALGYEGDYIVMPNGVDLPRGRVSDSFIAEATKDYDLPAGVPLFLFVGRMMWYKGIRIILEGLRRLADAGCDFRMVFVGGGGDKDEIVAFTESLGLSERVFFSAPIHDRELIRAWYCRADMFLFPSTFDTNGLVVREAAACALGSVLISGSCAAEDIRDGHNGLLIEENAESMAAMLLKLCREPDIMKRIGENAQRDIYVSWEDAVASAWERYGVVIENYHSGKYPTHDTLSDEFFHNIATAMELFNMRRDRQRAIRDTINRNYADFVDGISEDYEEIRTDITEHHKRMQEELSQLLDRFL